MNTLQDLRATLDRHAEDVVDDVSVARVAAVHGRARRARQQRAGAVVAAAALVVAGVVLAPPLGGRAPQPASAPDTLTSLGWTYRLASTESGGAQVVQDLGASATPRLVSWATAGSDQRVSVRRPGQAARTSTAGDYDDFAWVPPGPARIRLTSEAGGDLDVAVYEVDLSDPPAGVGEGALTFREDVAGLTLLGATLGEPGDASVEIEVTPSQRMLWAAISCSDLPRSTTIHVAWADEQGSSVTGGCGSTFDPGGSAGFGFPPGSHAGRPSTLRMWLTRADGEPIADGELPDARLGLGAYTYAASPLRIAGMTRAEQVEHDGRVWALAAAASSEVSRNGRLPAITVPDDTGRYAVAEAVSARGPVRYALSADGRRLGSSLTFLGPGGGGSGDLTQVDPGVRVSLEVGTPLDRLDEAGIALYRLAD